MAYSWYYNHFQGLEVPVGSRTRAYVFPGAVCPQQCQFGRVHGTAPARGSLSFKGTVFVPVGQIFWIQIGQSVFYGRAIKGEILASVSTGNATNFQLVDMRDRLHDVNHFAQYNMMDDDGTWWHILAEDWHEQLAKYILDLQDIEDFRREQEIQDIEVVKDSPPLFSAMTLLNYFAERYDFTFSFTGSAETKLRKGYPENLDFNGGKRVIDCLAEMLEKLNLQFTTWGDLHVHVTERGVADTVWEQQLLAGNIDLCSMRGHVNSALGGELNDQGRRVAIVGGRNTYEWTYPCYPDWNIQAWTLELCNDVGYQLSNVLQKNNVTLFHRLDDLPFEYRDFQKYNGKIRNELTIKEYIESIPFKAYQVDFGDALIEITRTNVLFLYHKIISTGNAPDFFKPRMMTLGDYVHIFKRPSGTYGYELFDWNTWYLHRTAVQNPLNSFYPLASKLPSDATRQFAVKATSRKFDMKGIRDEHLFAQGKRTWITDGVSLDIDDQINVTSPPNEPKDRARFWRVSVVFAEQRLAGSAVVGVGFNGEKKVDFQWKPDQVYIRIAQEVEIFQRHFGEPPTAPRVRQIVRSMPKLFQSYVDGIEQPILTASLAEGGFTNTVYAGEIATEIAERLLNNQMVTVAGHMEFRTNAGFMPSGIIDNISIRFDGRQGTQESINFTNIRSDERVPVFHAPLRKRTIKGEDELVRDRLREEGRRILRFYNTQKQGMPIAQQPENQFNRLDRAVAFGGDKNSAMVKVNPGEFPVGWEFFDGEVFVVGEADGV